MESCSARHKGANEGICGTSPGSAGVFFRGETCLRRSGIPGEERGARGAAGGGGSRLPPKAGRASQPLADPAVLRGEL